MFDLIGQAFISFGTFLQQSSTGNTQIDSIVSIVLAVGAIGGVAASVVKSVNKDSRLAVMLDTFSQKSVENEEIIRRVAKAVVDVVPEVEEPLKKHGADLKYQEERVVKGNGQLAALRDLSIKDKERAKHLVQLPRETKPVF